MLSIGSKRRVVYAIVPQIRGRAYGNESQNFGLAKQTYAVRRKAKGTGAFYQSDPLSA